jgi:predicted amidophosphoribosyltransferase
MNWRALLDVVFPAQCAECNLIGSGLCDACEPQSTPLHVRLPSLFVTARALYEGSMRTAVLAVKDGRRDVAEALGRIAAPLVAPDATLVPVPTTAQRLRVRGVDGVGYMARCAASPSGARVVPALRRGAGRAQHGRSRVERIASHGRFVCDASAVAGRQVTLFDDVCTTGATLRDCADAIREAGGIVDDAIVLAVANGRKLWSPTVLS